MSGNNMERLLMGGDDSSSGESDDEVNVPIGTATTAASAVKVSAPPPVAPNAVSVPATAQRVATIPTQAPLPAPNAAGHAPAPAPAPVRGKSSQAEQMARLKNLYHSKPTASGTSSTGIPSKGNQTAAKPLHRPPMQHSQRSPPQQSMPQQQRQPHQQMQQRQRQPHQQMQQRQTHQSVGSHQTSQHQHKRTQSYQQQSQQVQQQQQQQQQQQISSRSQGQPRQPQYSQSSSQQRQQYSQQSQQQRPPPQPVQHRQQMHRSQAQPRPGTSSQQQNQQTNVDPYAPTPLSQIKQSQHNRRAHHQQQMQSQRQSTQPMSSRMQQLPGSGSSANPGNREQDLKRQKEKFLMFTRVLIKYLEQKDRRMHAQAKNIIKDCAERNKRQEPGYESVTISMKRRLKELVGDHYWRKANDYLVHFIEQKRRHAQTGSSNSAQHAQARMRQKQAQQLHQQRTPHAQQRQVQPKMKKEQAINMPKQRPPVTTAGAPSLADEQKGNQVKREQLSSQVPTMTTKTTAKSKSKSTTPSKASGNDSKATTKAKTTKKAVRRKSAGDSTTASRQRTTSKTIPASSSTTTVVKRVVVEEPPREYKELMELIDHAVEYDWPSIGQLLGNKADLKITDEERQLLYSDSTTDLLNKKKVVKATTKISTSTAAVIKSGSSVNNNQEQSPNQKVSGEEVQADQMKISEDEIQPGWGRTNVVSARVAWSRIRLNELRERKLASTDSAPVVADGLLTLPTPNILQQQPPQQQQTTTSATVTSSTTSTQGPDTDTSATPKPADIEGSWINEETAEQDKVLALLSEGCQIYLKGVLQKVVQCARQRQNLDGIRLWHQQYSFSKGVFTSSSNNISKDNKNKTIDKSKKPPLALRLGCDVSRQVSQAHGNAALTVKRMEEALDRQTGIPTRVRELNTETLLEAASMGDLSWRPLLKQGAERADYQAKRSYEIYGGKEAKDPPLGRVPKKAKLLVEDFVMGSGLNIDGPYHKGYTASSFISF